jgi:hypothetical protein
MATSGEQPEHDQTASRTGAVHWSADYMDQAVNNTTTSPLGTTILAGTSNLLLPHGTGWAPRAITVPATPSGQPQP